MYLIKSIGVHYSTHMRRKKNGPKKVKRVLRRLDQVLDLEMAQCPEIRSNRTELDVEGEQYVTAQFENDNRWLKYVNDSISMKKADKVHAQTRWMERLDHYKRALVNKYKQSRLQIQSVVVTLHLLDTLMLG